MKKKLIVLLFLVFLLSCGDDAEVSDVFQNLQISPAEIMADGKSVVTVSVEINQESSIDRRKIVFKTSSGSFNATGTSSAIVDAQYENGKLLAKAVLKSGTKPGEVNVSVQPDFDSPVKEFVESMSVNFLPSVPSSFKIAPSSYGIASNFLKEVAITGYLKNASGNFVSEGYSVSFTDLLIDGTPAQGMFREAHLTTSDSSKVTFIYSSQNYPIGTQIKIIGKVKDSGLSDNIILTINE